MQPQSVRPLLVALLMSLVSVSVSAQEPALGQAEPSFQMDSLPVEALLLGELEQELRRKKDWLAPEPESRERLAHQREVDGIRHWLHE